MRTQKKRHVAPLRRLNSGRQTWSPNLRRRLKNAPGNSPSSRAWVHAMTMPKRTPSANLIVVMALDAVSARVGLDQASIDAGIAAGTFPRPMMVGGHPTWVVAEVEQWISTRITEGDETLRAAQARILHRPAAQRLVDAFAKEAVEEYLAVPRASKGNGNGSDSEPA
jgi:prophage regulatory protein